MTLYVARIVDQAPPVTAYRRLRSAVHASPRAEVKHGQ